MWLRGGPLCFHNQGQAGNCRGKMVDSTFTNASQESDNQQRPQIGMRCKWGQHCEERPHPHANLQDHIRRVAI